MKTITAHGGRRVSMWVIILTGMLAGPAAAAESVDMIRAAAPFPRIGEFEVLRGDFHMHTPHSDGEVPPGERVIEARRFGYDVIAITDHGKTAACDEAMPIADALGLILVRGIETGLCDHEHLVGLGFDEDFVPRDSHRWSETEGGDTVYYRQQWQHLSDSGGYGIYAHPHVGFREPMQWAIERGLLQGVEVKNDVVGTGWNTVDSHGAHWYPFALDLASEHGLAVFANSDIHGTREGNQAITLVLARERTPEGVMDALRSRRTVAWFNGLLCAPRDILSLLVDGLVEIRFVDAESGTRLLIENRGPVRLSGLVQAADEPALILEPYGRVCMELSGLHDEIAVRWANVWTGSTENLTTIHAR